MGRAHWVICIFPPVDQLVILIWVGGVAHGGQDGFVHRAGTLVDMASRLS